MSERTLIAYINDREVGTLREENDLWGFDYAPTWAAAGDGFDLSPSLPRCMLTHRDGASQRPVQWYFDNLLPEEALRTVFAKQAKVSEDDSFGLLAFYGAESAGSLVLRDPANPVVGENGLRRLTDEDLAERIRELPRLPLNHASPKHMSLAGAQHKLAVVYKEGEIFEPFSNEVSTHILKPEHLSGDYPSSVTNEYFVMRLADRLGLDVPQVWRHYCPEPVYLIERFDREMIQGVMQRRHMVDTCQLLNKARTMNSPTAKRLAAL